MKKAEERKKQAEGPARQAIEYFHMKNKMIRIQNKIESIQR